MKEKIIRAIKASIEQNDVAGVSVLVQKGNDEICFVAEGMADIEQNKPIARDTIFRLYSQTKPVCAAAAMILVERGLLDLYQPVSRYLPGFKNQKVWENGADRPVKREATIFDMLAMTAGTWYPDETCESGRQAAALFEEVDQRLYTDNQMGTIELANRIGGCSLGFDPGSSWNYSTCADVLGAVVEIVSGMRLGEFMKKEIFEPLGMNDTAFWVPQDKQDRLSKVYETVTDEVTGEKTMVRYHGSHLGIQNKMEFDPAYEAGGAGLASTLDDYMKFARMLLNGGVLNGTRILKEETVKFFTDSQLLDWQQQPFEERFSLYGFSYGKLMRVGKNPAKSAMLIREGEYGWDGWLGVYFANFPKEDMTILFGMQKKDSGTWELTRELRNIILSTL